MTKIKITIPLMIIASVLVVTAASYSPNDVRAEFSIPKISGSISMPEISDDYSAKAQIALSVAMTVSENAVENGKAMWGKLDVTQGFLVYTIGVLANDDIFHKVLVDAGTGELLYVSEGVSKDSWKHSKHSDGESHKKWKDHYEDLTPEEREMKKHQWSEVKDAFFALSIDERAKMIMHFMSMKIQFESLTDEERNAKKLEMKLMVEEMLPLSVEGKTLKLREFVNSL